MLSTFSLICVGIFGGYMNRLRGSIHLGGFWNIMLFSWTCLITFSSFEPFQPAYATAICAGLTMWAGQQPGWGRYIGALGGWERRELEEISFIDALIKKYKPTHKRIFIADDGAVLRTHRPKTKLHMWGFAGLTLRGFFWGLLLFLGITLGSTIDHTLFGTAIAKPTGVLWLSPLMGLVYLIPIAIRTHIGRNPGKGWEEAEYLYGAILWLGVVI